MPAAAESPYSQDWFRVAADDFKRVVRRLAEEDTEDAAFHLQQALEKYLKGYLLSKGWMLQRIHNLELLLDDAIRYDATLERYRELCQRVTGYYLIERYPAFEEGPSREEVRKAYAESQSLVRRLQVHLRKKPRQEK